MGTFFFVGGEALSPCGDGDIKIDERTEGAVVQRCTVLTTVNLIYQCWGAAIGARGPLSRSRPVLASPSDSPSLWTLPGRV